MAETKATNSLPAEAQKPAVTIPTCEFSELLEDAPLHSPRKILMLFAQTQFIGLSYPENIRVHCDHPKCGGTRRHWKHKDSQFQFSDDSYYYYVDYACSNCTTRIKVFGLKVEKRNMFTGVCTKIYEEPAFGQPIPKRIFQLIGESNREFFLQARRAIARGLGVGAYGYYRRIVENTKFELVASVLEVARATNASPTQIELLKKAQAETQFSKAIEILRDEGAIPAVLLIEGHNPLVLLHDLLSEGIHQLSDGECLKRTQEAEIVLCEIADRMQIAMTERKTVKAAITSIMSRKAAREANPAES